MRGFERSHSRGIDQAHMADDRKHIETRTHGGGTTWDDIANLRDQLNEMKSLIDELPVEEEHIEQVNEDLSRIEDIGSGSDFADEINQKTHEEVISDAREQVIRTYRKSEGDDLNVDERRIAAVERIDNLRMPDNELIELTSEWCDVEIDKEALQKSIEKNGNPNILGKGLFFSNGNLPMNDESVYRHVGSSAVVDLMIQGYVRNKREAANALDIPGKQGFGTIGAGVYWHNGDSQKREIADLVIQASKSAAEKGYVTKDDVQGVWVTDKNTGQPVNLIDGQDHTGIELANHKP